MNKSKQITKRIVDLAMIVLLPLLMAEILIGQEIHEWLGTVMLVLFVAHHLLNLGWWKGLLKRTRQGHVSCVLPPSFCLIINNF